MGMYAYTDPAANMMSNQQKNIINLKPLTKNNFHLRKTSQNLP